MNKKIPFQKPELKKLYFQPEEDFNEGLFLFLRKRLLRYPDKQIKTLMEEKRVFINGRRITAPVQIKAGDKIEIIMPPRHINAPEPENIPLNIVYEDEFMMVINKPAGIAVHPAPGTESHTIANALLHHCERLSNLSGHLEPGIVHRLDKDTSGLMLIAKNNKVHERLSDDIAAKRVKRYYVALVWGIPESAEGCVDVPIGASGLPGIRYAVSHSRGKPAKTEYKILESWKEFSLLSLTLQTGRTHQIRLHLNHIGHPVLGDVEYCKIDPERRLARGKNAKLIPEIAKINRQMLHACTIIFKHPVKNKPMTFESDPPEDFMKALSLVKKF